MVRSCGLCLLLGIWLPRWGLWIAGDLLDFADTILALFREPGRPCLLFFLASFLLTKDLL